MSDIAKGMLVQHASLGAGKVVAVEPTAVHVFFPRFGRRYAAKLRWPDARPLIRTDCVDRDPWLEGLSSFLLDPTERRYALATGWITHDQAMTEFLRDFPRGFADPAYLGTNGGAARARAPHWRAAHAEWLESMGSGEGERLVAAGDVRKLVERAVRIEKHVILVRGTIEAGTLTRAFEDPDAALPFFAALFELLASAPGRARFERLSVAANALEVEPALAWPIVTLFPFVADPGRHAFLSPRTACAAAKRLGAISASTRRSDGRPTRRCGRLPHGSSCASDRPAPGTTWTWRRSSMRWRRRAPAAARPGPPRNAPRVRRPGSTRGDDSVRHRSLARPEMAPAAASADTPVTIAA